MSNIVSVHSFRRGAGKSNLTANIAALLAIEGRRVGVVDTNLEAPSLYILFGLDETEITHSLNDYLWGKCNIEQIVYDVTSRVVPDIEGQIFLFPASTTMGDIKRTIRQGYDVSLFNYGCYHLIDVLELDILLIDTKAGMNPETLVSISIANTLMIIMRLDRQEYRGAAVMVDLARQIDMPHTLMVANEVPLAFDFTTVKARLEQIYECEVIAVLPHSDDLMALASADIFVIQYPDHPMTATFKQIAARLMAGDF